MIRVTDNIRYIAGSPLALIFSPGSRIVLVVEIAPSGEGSTGVPLALQNLLIRNEDCVNDFIQDLELVMKAFDDVTGKRPPIFSHGYNGRVRIEVSFLSNAAGLAHHGCAGFAVGPAFLDDCIKNRLLNTAVSRPFISHCFLYECCRNYIFPNELTPCFDYCCVLGSVKTKGILEETSADCWGWVNQGFVNVLGVLLVVGDERLSHIDVDYYGQNANQFLSGMERHLDSHILDATLSFNDTFMHERLAWDNYSSLDNVYSGILVRLFKKYGGVLFLRRFFRDAIPTLHANGLMPGSKADCKTAHENFYLACSISAREDLTQFFCTQLRMPLRQSCQEMCALVLLDYCEVTVNE